MTSEEQMREKLIAGWDWMKRCEDDDRRNTFLDEKFRPLLAVYEARYEGGGETEAKDRLIRKERPLPEPSPWIEDLREQLILGGIADVEAKPKRRLQE